MRRRAGLGTQVALSPDARKGRVAGGRREAGRRGRDRTRCAAGGADIGAAQEAAGAPITASGAETNVAVSSTYDRGHNTGVLDTPRQLTRRWASRGRLHDLSEGGDHRDLRRQRIRPSERGGGDFIFDVAPESTSSRTGRETRCRPTSRLDQDAYARLSSQDTTQYGAGLSGKLQFGGGFVHERGPRLRPFRPSHETSRTISASRSNPIEYDYIAFNDEIVAQFTRVRLSLRVDDQDYRYQNGQTSGGRGRFRGRREPQRRDRDGQGRVRIEPGHRGRLRGSRATIEAMIAGTGWPVHAHLERLSDQRWRQFRHHPPHPRRVRAGLSEPDLCFAAFKPVQGCRQGSDRVVSRPN